MAIYGLSKMLSQISNKPNWIDDEEDPENQDQQDVFTPKLEDINGDTSVTSADQQKPPSLFDRYQQLANRPMPITDAYTKETMNPPDPNQYKPTKMRRLAAILGGMAAGYGDPEKSFAYAESIDNAPYNQAQTDYKTKLANLKNLSQDEKDKLKLDLQGLNYQSLDQDRQDREAQRKADEIDKEKDRAARQKIDEDTKALESKRLDIELKRLALEGHHFETDNNGNVKVYDAEGKLLQDLGKVGKSEKELKQIEENAQTERTRIAGTFGLARQGLRDSAAMERINQRDNARMSELDKKLGSTKDANEKLTLGNLKNAIAADPELMDYLKLDNKGKFTVDDSAWGADATKVNKLKQILGGLANNSPQVLTKTQKNPATGQTRTVYSRDGGKTWSEQ